MKYLLIASLVFALVVPAFAEVIEITPTPTHTGASSNLGSFSPVFAGKSEMELSWDDGTSTGSFFPGTLVPFATTFTAPADCHLIAYRFYWSHASYTDLYCLLFADDGGGAPHTPTGDPVFILGTNTGSTSHDWFDVDVFGGRITFTNGEIFHPGWEGTYFAEGVMRDDPVAGSYACWVGPGGWFDYSADYVHMMRVVVNDDMEGPVANDQDPDDGDVGVAVDTDILFDIEDADIGVDSNTIGYSSVVVTDDTKATISGTLYINDSDPNDVNVTFYPDSDFVEGVTVTVNVSPAGYEITDDLGNEMAEYSWSFTVLTSTPTAFNLLTPADGTLFPVWDKGSAGNEPGSMSDRKTAIEVQPVSGGKATTNVDFTWEASTTEGPGDITYDWECDDDPAFGSPDHTATGLTSEAHTEAFTVTEDETWYWRVTAIEDEHSYETVCTDDFDFDFDWDTDIKSSSLGEIKANFK